VQKETDYAETRYSWLVLYIFCSVYYNSVPTEQYFDSLHIQSTWKNPTSSSIYARRQNIFQEQVYATTVNVLPDDGPVRSETYTSLMFLKTLLW